MATLGRVEKEKRGRVKPTQPSPVRIVSASKSGTVLTLTFDQPVVLKGTPAYTTNLAGPTALSATSPSPAVVAITFSATIATATTVTIPSPVEPAIRSKDGGYVANSTFPIT
jgi:hypothetical protein